MHNEDGAQICEGQLAWAAIRARSAPGGLRPETPAEPARPANPEGAWRSAEESPPRPAGAASNRTIWRRIWSASTEPTGGLSRRSACLPPAPGGPSGAHDPQGGAPSKAAQPSVGLFGALEVRAVRRTVCAPADRLHLARTKVLKFSRKPAHGEHLVRGDLHGRRPAKPRRLARVLYLLRFMRRVVRRSGRQGAWRAQAATPPTRLMLQLDPERLQRRDQLVHHLVGVGRRRA